MLQKIVIIVKENHANVFFHKFFFDVALLLCVSNAFNRINSCCSGIFINLISFNG